MSCRTQIPVLLVIAALALTVSHANAVSSNDTTCKLSDIKVTTVKTGKLVQGLPQYEVRIDNTCICAQWDIHVRCNGLPSVETVDASRIARVGDGKLCIVAMGSIIIHDLDPVTFWYSWKTQLSFPVVSAKWKCGLPAR